MPAAIPLLIAAGAGGAGAAIAGTSILTGVLVSGGLAGVQTLLAPRGQQLGTQRDDIRRREPVRLNAAPAWWVVGKARHQGLEVFRAGTTTTDHAFVLSHGAIEAVDRIVVNGDSAQLVPSTTAGTYQPASGSDVASSVRVTPYLDADGEGGATLRTAQSTWTDEHRLEGVSWAHVRLPSSVGTNPKIEFVTRGIKIRMPGQAEARWTDSAAAIRFWWLTERRRVAASDISRDSLFRAHGICSEPTYYLLPGALLAYPSVETTYAINGLIRADDDAEGVESEMDYAWSGSVAVGDGAWTFHPGYEAPVAAVIRADDIAEVVSTQTSPAWERRFNGVSQELAQEATHGYVELAMPTQIDLPAREIDGEDLIASLRQRAFVTSALAAGRIAQLMLRRELASRRSWTVRIRSGGRLERLHIRAGDVLRVAAADYGLTGQRVVVQAVTLNSDMSLTLLLMPDIDYRYNYVSPPIPPGRGRVSVGSIDAPGDTDPQDGDYYA